jgi:hypothetical protein
MNIFHVAGDYSIARLIDRLLNNLWKRIKSAFVSLVNYFQQRPWFDNSP